ncbi:MAG: DUF3604 domain-containing protein [Planctomycetes bacterium]|nr:DUF3604 domain-containing protein [Planctomycetota bacterium]
MTNNSESNQYGRATIDPPSEIIAGSYCTVRLSFQAGEKGIAAGGSIRVYTDTDTDWGIAQFLEPAADDYASVEAPDGVHVGIKTVGVKALQVTIAGRPLKPGETITIVFGDTSGGSPGTRAQTFFDEKRYFWVDVDPAGDGETVKLTESPYLSIVGDEAIRLVLIVPSTIPLGETFRALVKAEDKWGNPSPSYRGRVTFSGEGIETAQTEVTFRQEDSGAKWIEGFRTSHIGTLSLRVSDNEAGLHATSNPVLSTEQPGPHRLLWADPHGGQLVLNSKIAGFYRYARDVAGIHFVGYQRNADVISAEDWEVQQREERDFYEPGVFVPIPGFEWSGRTWQGGHHNIYFRRHNQPARRNMAAEEMFQPETEREAGELGHVLDVYKAYRNEDVIITPHVGGEHSDLTYHDPTLEPAVEMVSTHGMFEWMQRDALKRKYKLGFLGGSDSYTGRPGDDRPGYQLRRYSKAGLTGIYAKDISLESFFEAMKARRVFATTGARMILSFKGDGHCMGSEYSTAQPPTLAGSVTGTGPLEAVELFRGLEKIHTVPLDVKRSSNRVRILWSGSSRMTSYSGVIWDGALSISGAKIVAAETVRFDSPRSHITRQTEHSIHWHAWGCGYPMGLVLELENIEQDNVVLRIAVNTQTMTGPAYGGHGSTPPRRVSFAPAEQMLFNVSLQELESGCQEFSIGVLDRKLNVAFAPESAPSTAEFQFTDATPEPGINPYWFRVIQTDQEHAWTSPVFVDYVQ